MLSSMCIAQCISAMRGANSVCIVLPNCQYSIILLGLRYTFIFTVFFLLVVQSFNYLGRSGVDFLQMLFEVIGDRGRGYILLHACMQLLQMDTSNTISVAKQNPASTFLSVLL